MTAANIQHFTIYFISLIISIGVGLIAWRRRNVKGARTYAALAFGQGSITVGYIMELASSSLNSKLFWDDFQWMGFLLWAVLFPIFSLQFSNSAKGYQRKWWVFFSTLPAVFTLLIVTNPYHGIVHQDAWIEPGMPFSALRYEFTPGVWAFALYGYVLIAVGFVNLIASYLRTHPIYRMQVGMMLIGVGIPIFGTFLALIGVRLSFQRDITPISLAIGNLFVGWGLWQYRLFDIIPIASDMVVEHMDDFVFVFDMQDRVVDLNPAAEKLFENERRGIIGKTVFETFSPWMEDINLPEGFVDGELQIQATIEGHPSHLDVHGTTIKDHHGADLGRVFVARNITRQKDLERELRQLNAELEDRVTERTRDLAEAYDYTLEGWAAALELWDKETEGHSRRVMELTLEVARAVGLPEDEMADIKRGALLHDIGKMGVPNDIINKPDRLTPDEWDVMKQHPVIGRDLLSHITFLEKALEIPCSHHERWDGKGYPIGLKGEEIPISARIFSLVDHWDALLSDRPYRVAWEKARVVEYIREHSGSVFDPELVEVFLGIVGR